MVGKAEHLPKGPNPRFLVTNLPSSRIGKQALYEQLYCPRDQVAYCASLLTCDSSSAVPLAA